MSDGKIGEGHAAEMFRAGHKEIAQALQAFPGQGIQPVEEPGLVNNLTPQEIVQDKAGYEQMLDGYSNRPQPAPQMENELER